MPLPSAVQEAITEVANLVVVRVGRMIELNELQHEVARVLDGVSDDPLTAEIQSMVTTKVLARAIDIIQYAGAPYA